MKRLFVYFSKTLFKSKVFLVIMSVILFLTGFSYTLLESVTSSFRNSSYDLLVQENLHDYIVKSNVKINPSSKLELEATIVEQETEETSEADTEVLYNVEVTEATGDYAQYLGNEYQVEVKPSSQANQDGETDEKEAVSLVEEEIENDVLLNLSDQFASAIQALYPEELVIQNTESITVSNYSDESVFKVVYEDSTTGVNDLMFLGGDQKLSEPWTDEQMNAILELMGLDSTSVDKSKGYKWTVGEISPEELVDLTSYEAIVSPSYAENNNIVPVAPEDKNYLINSLELFKDDPELTEQLVADYENNIVYVGEIPYVVVNIGTRPDFAYPIIDFENIVPDLENQAIVFVNKSGYERTKDSYRSNYQENYFSIKFLPGVSPSQQQDILEEISSLVSGEASIAQEETTKQISTLVNTIDSSNQVNQLQEIKDLINAFVGLTPEDRMAIYEELEKSLATSQPEYSQIAADTSQRIQDAIVYVPDNIFPGNIELITSWDEANDEYFLVEERVTTLVEFESNIQAVSYFFTTFLIVFAAFILVFSFRVLISNRLSKLSTLMALGYSRNVISWAVAAVTSIFMVVPTVLSYFAGLALQGTFMNIFEDFWTIPTVNADFSWISLFIVVVLPALFIIVLIWIICYFSLSGKLMDMVNNISSGSNSLTHFFLKPFKFFGIKVKYGVALTFKNFTKLVVVFLASTFSMVTMIVAISSIGIADEALLSTQSLTSYTYKIDLYTPTAEGGNYQNKQMSDLEDMSLYKTFEEHNSGESQDDVYWYKPNPSDENYYLNVGDLKGTEVENASLFLKNQIQTQYLIENEETIGRSAWDTASAVMPESQLTLSEEATLEIENEVSSYLEKPENQGKSEIEAFFDLLGEGVITPYLLTYNTIVTNESDELYTYAQILIDNTQYTITGIKKDSAFVDLPEDVIKTLDSYVPEDNGGKYPVVINQYVSEKHGLTIGDSLGSVVENKIDRNYLENTNKAEVEFEIVAVVNSYDDKGIFTLDKFTKEMLGVGEEDFDTFFNGVFTAEQGKDSYLIRSIPLYSPANIYFANDSVIEGDWDDLLLEVMEENEETFRLIIKDFDNLSPDEKVNEFVAMYSSTPYVSMFENVEWSYINDYVFENTSNLVSNILVSAEIVFICVSLLFSIIIGFILISSNRKRIATLWALGYRKNEIIRIFLTTQALPIFLAVCVAFPVSVGVFAFMKAFIMSFGNILIPFALTPLGAILPVIIISAIFVLSIVLGIAGMKQTTALEAFKNE